MSLTHGAPITVVPFRNDSVESDAGLIAERAASHAVAERGGSITSGNGSLALRGTVERISAVPAGTGWWRVEGRVRLELFDPAHPEKIIAHSTVSDVEGYRSASITVQPSPLVSMNDASATEAARHSSTDRLIQKLVSAAVDRLAP